MDRSRRAAEFARDLQWGDVPADVQASTLRCVLDLCGCAIAGSRTRVVEIMKAYARDAYGAGRATIKAQPGTARRGVRRRGSSTISCASRTGSPGAGRRRMYVPSG